MSLTIVCLFFVQSYKVKLKIQIEVKLKSAVKQTFVMNDANCSSSVTVISSLFFSATDLLNNTSINNLAKADSPCPSFLFTFDEQNTKSTV